MVLDDLDTKYVIKITLIHNFKFFLHIYFLTYTCQLHIITNNNAIVHINYQNNENFFNICLLASNFVFETNRYQVIGTSLRWLFSPIQGFM